MRYKYIAAYNLIGVTRPAGAEDQVIAEFPALSAKAHLAYDADGYIQEIDKATVIGFLMLKGIFADKKKHLFEESLATELSNLRKERSKEISSKVFVIFEAVGKLESFESLSEVKKDGFVVAMEAPPKQPIKNKYKSAISGIISSFSLGTNQICGAKKVSDGVVFYTEDNEPLYSYNLVGGKATISTGLDVNAIEFVKKYSKVLAKNQIYTDSSRLLAKSLDEENDELQSFLSVWSGLEIFINKTFSYYESLVYSRFSREDGSTVVLSKFLDRIKRVMKDKYRLSDKFSVICFELDQNNADQDMEEFEKIKNIRDKLMHGNDIDVSTLPIHRTRVSVRSLQTIHL